MAIANRLSLKKAPAWQWNLIHYGDHDSQLQGGQDRDMSASDAIQAAHGIGSWKDVTDAQCNVNMRHIGMLGRLRGLNPGMKRMPNKETNLQG